MSEAIDGHTKRRLAYVKGLFTHSIELLESGGELDAGLGVVALDNSVEMAIYVCLEHFEEDLSKRISFHEAIDKLARKIIDRCEADGPAVLHKTQIKNMHDARNSIQHRGQLPSLGDVDRYKALTLDILQDTIKTVFEVDFDDITLGLLIKDPLVRGLYERAEQAAARTQYRECLVSCAVAFERAQKEESTRLWGSMKYFSKLAAQARLREKLHDLGEYLEEYFDSLDEEIEVLKLRLDYKEYQKFRQIFGFVIKPNKLITSASDIEEVVRAVRKTVMPSVQKIPEDKLEQDAKFSLSFTIESILKWEATPRARWMDNISESLVSYFERRRGSSRKRSGSSG